MENQGNWTAAKCGGLGQLGGAAVLIAVLELAASNGLSYYCLSPIHTPREDNWVCALNVEEPPRTGFPTDNILYLQNVSGTTTVSTSTVSSTTTTSTTT